MRSPKTFRKVGKALAKTNDDPNKNMALKELLRSQGLDHFLTAKPIQPR